MSALKRATDSILEMDELEAQAPPLCKACTGCGECRFRREKCSEEERQVLERGVEREMVLKGGQLKASYPWLPCAERMRSNHQQVEKIQQSIKARLIKKGLHHAYITEFQKAETEGTVVELSSKEMDNYRGPVNYNNHFEVINENSSSTRLRIVSNSAQKNARSGLSLNDCTAKGPDLLALLEDVLLHFRTLQTAIILDLTKAYPEIHTGEKEKHLRRILWRLSPEEEWRDFGFTRATFGDLAAGLLLEVAKQRAADVGEHIDPMAAQQIRKKLYLDDGANGGKPSDVERMKGKEISPGQYDGTIGKILETCGLKAKFMAVTGDKDPEAVEPVGGKVLGLSYKLAEDQLELKVPMQFKIKGRGGQKKVVELGKEELERIRRGDRSLSKREALSFVMGAFDPLGYIGPVLLQGKLLLAMSRCVRPEGARGQPSLAGFSDASASAMCAVVYVVWDATPHQEARLILGKVRVTPLHGSSVPRSELQAMVMLVRILATVLRAAAFSCTRVSLATDSACCIATLSRPGAALHPYFSNRVAEITHSLAGLRSEFDREVENFCHVEGKLNPADVGTRPGVKLSDLGPGSMWQGGPGFLKLPRSQWPLKEKVTAKVPEGELRRRPLELRGFTAAIEGDVSSGTKEGRKALSLLGVARKILETATSWNRAQGTLARVLLTASRGERSQVREEPGQREREAAKRVLLLVASESAQKALAAGTLLSLGAQAKGGLVVVSGRAQKAILARLLGLEELVGIMPQEALAKIVMQDSHREDHRRTP